MNFIYNLLITLCSLSLFIIVYFVQMGFFFGQNPYLMSFLYLLIPIAFSGVSLLIARALPEDSIDEGCIREIELCNDTYLPTYLAYFFVALSIADNLTFCIVLIIITIFVLYSHSFYFNPYLMLFGYKFYHIRNSKNMKIMIISRQSILNTENLAFGNLRRINYYTYVDMEKDE